VPGDTPTLPTITLLPVLVTAEPASTAKLAALPKGTAVAAKEHAADNRNMLKVFTNLLNLSFGGNFRINFTLTFDFPAGPV
jgi:hypothetical protein